MENKHYQYKRIFMFWAGALFVAIQTGMYAWLWYNQHAPNMKIQYYRRGDWAVIALYALMAVLFLKIFGGFKVGYLRNMDVLYGQALAILFQNGVAYLQLSLLGLWKFGTHIETFIYLMIAEGILALVWTLTTRYIYARLYPPHQMLFIYGDIDPSNLVNKLARRRDRY